MTDYSNFYLNPQRKYVWRRMFLYTFLGIPFAWLLLKALALVITFFLEIGIY